MQRIRREIKVETHDNIKLKIDSGYACSGEVSINLFNTVTGEGIDVATVNLEDGERIVGFTLTEDVSSFIVSGYGKANPLPGKSETRVMITVIDNDQEIDKFDIEEGMFKFILIPVKKDN